MGGGRLSRKFDKFGLFQISNQTPRLVIPAIAFLSVPHHATRLALKDNLGLGEASIGFRIESASGAILTTHERWRTLQDRVEVIPTLMLTF